MSWKKPFLALEVCGHGNNSHTPTLYSRETRQGDFHEHRHRSWVERDSTQSGGGCFNNEAKANYQESPAVFTEKRASVVEEAEEKMDEGAVH